MKISLVFLSCEMNTDNRYILTRILLGSCNLGSPLNSKIEVYLGLSGGNFGLCNCEGGSEIASATCNNKVRYPLDKNNQFNSDLGWSLARRLVRSEYSDLWSTTTAMAVL